MSLLRRVDLDRLSPIERAALVQRSPVPDAAIQSAAAEIVSRVRTGGDAALGAAGARFGGDRPGARRVDPDETAAALAELDPAVVAALRHAAANIRRFQEALLPRDVEVEVEPGITVARRWAPLRRVGAYVPGGEAAYPSTLLMTVIPAQVAGVAEIAVAVPAGRDGRVAGTVLAAAALLGVDEVYVMGGAQAVAALAYGTETISRVEKIVGPGNAWVTAAKLAVFGDCAIDLPAGPSEVVVVADASTDPRLAAADLLSQAEHGPDSPAVLVSADPAVLDAVLAEVDRMLPRLERADVIAAALAGHGLAVLAPDPTAALDFALDYAPEHLTLLTADPVTDAKRTARAGSVFVGDWAPEPVGDYASGANHVLPTGGTAATMNPLSVEDFGSWRQVQTLSRTGLERLRTSVAALATAEGLTAHRLAVEIRFEEGAQP